VAEPISVTSTPANPASAVTGLPAPASEPAFRTSEPRVVNVGPRTTPRRAAAATLTSQPGALQEAASKPGSRTTPAPGRAPVYANCAAVRAAGVAPIRPGDPGFQTKFDRDDDGIGCEASESAPVSLTTSPTGSTHYANCTAVRAAGAAPIRPGDPGFQAKFDRDDDGIGCEVSEYPPTSTSTSLPTSSSTAPPTSRPASTSYANCAAVRAAGAAPIRSGDPGFQTKFDGDGDGIGCE
jgi:hypothetical protein